MSGIKAYNPRLYDQFRKAQYVGSIVDSKSGNHLNDERFGTAVDAETWVVQRLVELHSTALIGVVTQERSIKVWRIEA